MNIGKCKNQPKYICDKCGKEIIGYHRNSKKYEKPHKYYKCDKWNQPRKDFDLCSSCEKLFRQWLKEKEIPTVENLLSKFEIYKEDKR